MTLTAATFRFRHFSNSALSTCRASSTVGCPISRLMVTTDSGIEVAPIKSKSLRSLTPQCRSLSKECLFRSAQKDRLDCNSHSDPHRGNGSDGHLINDSATLGT